MEHSNRETIARLGEVAVWTLPEIASAAPDALATAGAVAPARLATVARVARRRVLNLAAWRHMWREAAFRVSGIWAEFVDWLRGR